MHLPGIRAWARGEFPAYTDGEIDRVPSESSIEPRTRSELFWPERAPAKSSAYAVSRQPTPAVRARRTREVAR